MHSFNKIPFLFAIRKYDGDKVEPGSDGVNPIVEWVVVLADWAYSTEDMKWAKDLKIGNYPLVPSIDTIDEKDYFILDSEEKALVMMAELWAQIAAKNALDNADPEAVNTLITCDGKGKEAKRQALLSLLENSTKKIEEMIGS